MKVFMSVFGLGIRRDFDDPLPYVIWAHRIKIRDIDLHIPDYLDRDDPSALYQKPNVIMPPDGTDTLTAD